MIKYLGKDLKIGFSGFYFTFKKRSHQHECQGDCVEDEVLGLVVGVEAGHEEEDDGDDGQELPRRRVLKTVVKLLPVSQTTNGAWK